MQVSFIVIVFIQLLLLQTPTEAQTKPQNEEAPKPPQPIQTASYVSLDGLTLVVIFDKPVNLSSYIELVERRKQNEAEAEEAELAAAAASTEVLQVRTVHPHLETQTNLNDNDNSKSQQQCTELSQLANSGQHETQEVVHGIQLCARLLTKKTLKLLHKYRLHDCIWPSRVQFLVQLGKPVAQSGPIKISFQRQTIGEFSQESGESGTESPVNDREISLDLSRLPLESLGVPLAPKLAITGPNQVPSCGQFVLSAHLSSPFGTQPEESVRLSWSVERVGFIHPASLGQQHNQPPMMLFNGSQLSPAARANQINADSQGSEARWKQFQALVSSTRANNLVIDSALLQFSPQIYEFRLSASFSTSLTSVSLNASHQVSRLDFETPVGAIYGSHILAQQPQLNTNQELLLLADIQVPDCAQSIKQVGLYWQVSDSRVRFEQTYAPYYLARPNTLPDQSQIEFRLNVFYGIRVKKYSTSSALIATGDSVLDAQISGGALVLNIGQDSPSNQLELFGGGTIPAEQQHQLDKYTYQWSCFDGKTAQPCFRTKTTDPNNSSSSTATSTQPSDTLELSRGGATLQPSSASTGLPLIDRQQQRQTNLRLPLGWLDPEAQLWFGLQRFDRHSASQQSQTEYALVELQPGHSATLSIGPVLVGPARQIRATLRNPLTGAILLLANSPAIVVGRLSPAAEIKSFIWHSPNHMGQLHWTSRNATNPITGQEEIYTELHLSPQQQVAHAHSQIQLIACTRHGAQQLIQNELMTASLNLDTVQSVSQCRVSASLLSQSSLAVSVEHCNIPLGLSPVTYQIYLVDTTGLDGFMAENNPATPPETTTAAAATRPQPEDDYINEADVAFFESQAQPLTMPQLSPVFVLNGLNPLSLAALLGDQSSSSSNSTTTATASVRFGGRVCDRLQTCRSFYSAPVGLKQLLADWQLRAARQSASANNQSLPLTMDLSQQQQQQQPTFGRQQASSLLQSLQSMIDSSKRANMAGNSIGAISILNAAMTLGQRLLDGDSGTVQSNEAAEQQQQPSKLLMNFRDRVRDSLQTSMRDCLHYGSVSLQRQFHYTDSGQTNLVLHSLSRILSLPQSNIELKFRALKLISQLTRRTIQEQLALKSNCLADLKTIQRAFESLFGTFTHFAIDTTTATTSNDVDSTSGSQPISESAAAAATSNSSATSDQSPDGDQSGAQSNRHQQWANYSSSASDASRRKRGQEAALAYLRSVRGAYRALLAAAAIQLPLGEAHQFRYSAAPAATVAGGTGAQSLRAAAASNSMMMMMMRSASKQKPSASRSDQLKSADSTTSSTTTTTTTTTSGDININNGGAVNKLLPLPLISSDILSSLTHLTGSSDLLQSAAGGGGAAAAAAANKSLDVNFNQLGFVSITFDQRFLQRLAELVREGRLLCRNDTGGAPGKSAAATTTATATATTTAAAGSISASAAAAVSSAAAGAASTLPDAVRSSGNCSSFVLALTTFAGKAPFRSLDEGLALRVPHVEISLLSPIDGSDLLGLQQQQEALMANDDIKTEVTFTIPNLDGEKPTAAQQQQQQDSGHGSAAAAASKRRYKCYQFDEESNEWIRVSQGERNEVEQQEKRIKCTFNGFGVFAAFQGKPPPAEAPFKSPVVIGLLALVALIIIISISLCCCSANGTNAGAIGNSSSSNSSDDGDDKRAIQRHPEQTYRSDFDYPRVGGG